MAVSLIAIANGNLTSSSTWGTSNAGALNITGTTSVGITASYQLSSTFTPGAVTVDGIAVRVNTRPGSSGTLSIALDQGGSTVVGTEVTINVTDIPAAGTTWIMTQFTGVLLAAATLYSVKIKASGTSLVTCFATSGTNWLRQLRVPGTTATPGAGDAMYIFGEKTGAGAQTTRTVTMDDAAGGATVYGVVGIGAGGTMSYGTTGGVAYDMKLAGNCTVYSGGELDIGTSSSRIPSNSSAVLEFSNSSNVDFGLEILGSGTLKTGGNHNAVPWALLAADASAGATSLTTDRTTGWLNGDTIAIASTTRTVGQCESKTLTADASGTTLTITAITNDHGGNTSTLVTAELANLTRNVKIHGTSTTFQSYLQATAAATCDLNDTEFYFMGSNTSGKRGVVAQTTTGSFSATYCSFHDFSVASSVALLGDTSAGSGVTVSHCVFYNINCPSNIGGFMDFATATATNAVTATDCVGILSVGGSGFRFSYNCSASFLRAAGTAQRAILLTGQAVTGTFSDFVAHSATTSCLEFAVPGSGVGPNMSNVSVWRGTSNGILFSGGFNGLVIDGLTAFGCATVSINYNSTINGVTIINGDIRAGATLTCPLGMDISVTSLPQILLVNTVFGGSGQTHSTGDIRLTQSNTATGIFLLDNCTLNSSTQIVNPTNLGASAPPFNLIRANFLGQTQNHQTWLPTGTWSYDAATFVVSPSLRLTPTSATVKLQSPSFYAGATSGQAVTASVAVRTSLIASGDSQTYNGNAPRLIVRRNYGAGITSDTVLATATGASSGAFETISGTTAAVGANCALEFFVDCDGTQGWVNVDSLSLLAA